MPHQRLPEPPDWRLQAIDTADLELAAEIDACPSPKALIDVIAGALSIAITAKAARFSREEARDPRGGHRAAGEFLAPRQALEQFFNGRTGYRAHFYASEACGHAFNDEAVATLRAQLAGSLPDLVPGFDINTIGNATPAEIPREFLLRSLAVGLSKIWVGEGFSFTGPRILLPDGRTWPSMLCQGDVAWIELKGAFVPSAGPLYQPKDPKVRAASLHANGVQ